MYPQTPLTEQRPPHTLHLDELATLEVVALLQQEDKQIAAAVENALPAIAALVDAVVEVLAAGGRLIYVGAGTSGRLGVLDASECPPTFGVDPRQVVGLIAGGDLALRHSIEGAEDNTQQAVQDLQAVALSAQDILIGIAASGSTPYTFAAMRYARSRGAQVGCVVNTPHSAMQAIAHHPIVVLCGPEALTGSTRMKAGTAQKMVLNLISTAAMVQLGKVYENLMVDLLPSNAKLRARALHILCTIADVDPERAAAALERFSSVKKAAFALLTGTSDAEVDRLLAASNGHLKRALQAYARQTDNSP
ncbi:MAG: N-acetylmuramic acid 6-phosphate etherase [Caldilinea sp.]|jgi:N-acetylmuramic acid 6-phosphate etherase